MLSPTQARHRIAGIIVASVLIATAGCYHGAGSVLERMSEAQRLARDLYVHFTQGADATNLAVMVETDTASAAFARDARQQMDVVQNDARALRPILNGLTFSDEIHLLDQFEKAFANYRALDRAILHLSVEQTNLKAQRLSIGPAREAVERFRGELERVTSAAPATDSWQAQALAANALASVREIEVLEAPHIVEAKDDAMTRIEKRMSGAEDAARKALKKLATLLPPPSRPQLLAAESALNEFLDLNREILALSRRNSNVRSLSLTLGEKRRLTAQCEDTLRALNEALAKRGFVATR
jgi:hypothetical protein